MLKQFKKKISTGESHMIFFFTKMKHLIIIRGLILLDCKTDLFLFSYYDKYNDELVSVMKNVETQEKIFKKLEKPRIPVYKTIENQDIFREFVKMSEVKAHMCSYKWREWDIARLLNVNNFNDMVKEGVIGS